MTVFVDTSVFMRRLLRQPGAFTDWSAWDLAVSSELLRVEAHRVLDRLRLQRAFGDAELAELHRLLQALNFGGATWPRASCCPLRKSVSRNLAVVQTVVFRLSRITLPPTLILP